MNEQVKELEKLIQEAWCAGNGNEKDKFGDFLKRAEQAIIAAGYRKLSPISDERLVEELAEKLYKFDHPAVWYNWKESVIRERYLERARQLALHEQQAVEKARKEIFDEMDKHIFDGKVTIDGYWWQALKAKGKNKAL